MQDPIYTSQTKGMIRVEYIVDETCDENDPIYRKIIEYCTLMNIKFTIRIFDSIKYDEDREYITRLPAIHIYEKFEYVTTAFPEDKIINIIREQYEKSELEMLEYISKKQIWDERLKFLKRIFKRDLSKTDSLPPKIINSPR